MPSPMRFGILLKTAVTEYYKTKLYKPTWLYKKSPKQEKNQAPNAEYNSVTSKSYLSLSSIAKLKGQVIIVAMVVTIIICRV